MLAPSTVQKQHVTHGAPFPTPIGLQIGSYLHSQGVGKGDEVAIYM